MSDPRGAGWFFAWKSRSVPSTSKHPSLARACSSTALGSGIVSRSRLVAARQRAGLVLALCILGPSGHAQNQSLPAPAFSETPCQASWYTTDTASRFRCGSVEVPRSYANPERGTFRVHIVILRSSSQRSDSSPLVFHAGGPGFATTRTLPGVFSSPEFSASPVFAGRDIIFFDERGSGGSDPQICVDFSRAWVDALAADLTAVELITANHREVLRCREEMRVGSIAPEDFGTVISAQDLETVRRALDIEQWNLLGVSYSSLLFMTYTALYPQAVRFLLLDSPAVPDGMRVHRREGFLRALNVFLAKCQADALCRGKYPDLSATIDDVAAQLDESPLIVPVDAQFNIAENRFVFNRGDFDWLLFRALYNPGLYGALPGLIHAVRERRADALSAAVVADVPTFADLSILSSVGVECRDMPHFHEPIELSYGFEMIDLNGVCSQWGPIGDLPLVPQGTRVPTLVLSGEVDPATPPANARAVTNAIGESAQLIEFPSLGHATINHPCAQSIIAARLEDPTAQIDASCVTRIAPIQFQ